MAYFCLHGLGKVNVPIHCGGVQVKPGDIVLGDCDGVVVVPQEVEDEVFAKAEAKFEKEKHLVEELKAGKTPTEPPCLSKPNRTASQFKHVDFVINLP